MKIIKKLAIIIISLLVVQITFFYIQMGYEKSVILSIQALINQEAVASNPYSIAQGIENLESIDLIRCSKLTNKKTAIVYVDTAFKGGCETSFLKLNGRFLSTDVAAVNGEVWSISTVSNNNAQFFLMIWIIRLLTIALGLSLLKVYDWKINSIIAIKNLELVKQKHLAQVASQVSHDIRSPLAALKMTLEQLDNIPEDYRNIIRSSVRRINDIANNLLNYNKEISTSQSSQFTNVMLTPLIDSLVTEKRMQYRDLLNIEIIEDLSQGYGLFALIDPVELNRILSNLINNSIEAMTSGGQILIKILGDNNKITISIQDNGKGIPESILSQIGTAGFSHGKNGSESGSGLGIHHAKTMIASFKGNFEIQSVNGKGTLIIISLPKAGVPDWFTEELAVSEGVPIIVLDDDDSIHKLWANRFLKKVTSFSSVDQFCKMIEKIKDEQFLCLVDYELHDQNKTGLQVIESLGIEKKSILVTSHYDEKAVQDKALDLGVSIIPKMLASLVNIKFTSSSDSNIFYDYVYIEDEELLRISWERKAKKSNIKLLTLISTSNFMDYIEQISKEKTSIYIDNELGRDEVSGEIFATKLYESGFQNIFIASGYDASKFSHLPWLKIAGKKCPF